MSLKKNINAYIGYIPLHSSKMGIKLGGHKYDLPITDSIADRIIRLPFFLMNNNQLSYVLESYEEILVKIYTK